MKGRKVESGLRERNGSAGVAAELCCSAWVGFSSSAAGVGRVDGSGRGTHWILSLRLRTQYSARRITTDVHQYTVRSTEDALFPLRMFWHGPVTMLNQLSWEEPLPKLARAADEMSRNKYLSLKLRARTKRLSINLSVVWPRGLATCNQQWQEKVFFKREKPWTQA